VFTLPSNDILAIIVDQVAYSEGHKVLIEARRCAGGMTTWTDSEQYSRHA